MQRSNNSNNQRRGVSAVEMALVLPILLTVVFGTLSLAEMISFRKSLVTATAEGTRIASQRTASADDVAAIIDQILLSRDIESATVTITPENLAQLAPGDLIQIDVQAEFSGLGVPAWGALAPLMVTVNAAILRE